MPKRTDAYVSFKLPAFEDLKASGDGYVPRGDLLRVALNPFTGEVVVSYQSLPVSIEAIDRVLDVINDTIETVHVCEPGIVPGFQEFIDACYKGRILKRFSPCPFCGEFPTYDHERGTIECCDGMLSLGHFHCRDDALKAWNSREAFSDKAA